MGFGDGFVWWG